MIKFQVSGDRGQEFVVLEIFNIRGNRVRTLISGYKEAGIHNVIWDSTDDNGNTVSSGIYFYRMETANFTQSKRMLLLK
jgi:flagellar hook assembly protein FlgD